MPCQKPHRVIRSIKLVGQLAIKKYYDFVINYRTGIQIEKYEQSRSLKCFYFIHRHYNYNTTRFLNGQQMLLHSISLRSSW